MTIKTNTIQTSGLETQTIRENVCAQEPPTPPVAGSTRNTIDRFGHKHSEKRNEGNTRNDLLSLTSVRSQECLVDNELVNDKKARSRPRLILQPRHALIIILLLTASLCASLTLFIQQANNLSQVSQLSSSGSSDPNKINTRNKGFKSKSQKEKNEANPNSPETSKTDPGSLSDDTNSKQSLNGVFNLNTVTTSQLETIKGIGPVMAKKIIDYRSRIGAFTTVDQLLEVPGIGMKTLNRIKENLVVQ